MELIAKAYGNTEVGSLETALFTAVSDRLEEKGHTATPQDVADVLLGRHNVPSDSFWGTWDIEVHNLAQRFVDQDGE